MMPLYVTKPSLPNRERLNHYIDRIYETHHLTSNGPLVKELEERLQDYLGVENLLLVANGTLALQVAFRALGITGEAVTTPFTYVATASSLVCEGIKPVFVDIERDTLNLDPELITSAITEKTSAIVPVHVFGNSCDVGRIQEIADTNNLKVIYDAAHAFGVNYDGTSLLSFGDASILSFQATKVFNTAEGGAIVFKDKDALERARRLIQIGYSDALSEPSLGTNAKMNEFEAALGNALLDEFSCVVDRRRQAVECYDERLQGVFETQKQSHGCTKNYSYYPILFKDEKNLLSTLKLLTDKGVYPRRYFYPSIDEFEFLGRTSDNPVSNDVSRRILCLPLSAEISMQEVNMVCDLLLGI